MESLFSKIITVAEGRPNKVAFRFLDPNEENVEITFEQFRNDLYNAAEYFTVLSREKNKRIGILAKNSYEYIVCLLGILGSGSTAVLLNMESSWKEVQYEINLSELDYIVQDGEYSVLESEFQSKYWSLLLPLDVFRERNDGEKFKITKVDEESLAIMLFTSGTTGVSKGVMLSHENIDAGVYSCTDYLEKYIITQEDDMYLECFPFYHVGGIIDTLSWIVTGKSMVINMDKRFFFRDITYYPCTYTSLVPAILETIGRYFKRGKTDCIGTVKKILVSAAKCEPELFQFFKKFSVSVYQLYGLSENTGIGLINFSGAKFSSIGTEQKYVKVKVENNEICLSGRAVMSGYLKNPAETEKVIKGEWLHTGDLGYMDEDGYVYITGRKKNLIILSSGENVSPEELESLLLNYEDVREVIVKEESNKICAEIFCDVEKQNQIGNVVNLINQSLPYYKRITKFKLRDQPFERTASGKIKR